MGDKVISIVQFVGDRVVSFASITFDFFALALSSLKRVGALRLSPVRKVFFKQIYFTGIEALDKILVIALLCGLIIITQVVSIIGVGNPSLCGKILVWIIIRELAPLFSAILVIIRSGTAISTELGTMKVRGELDSLEIMGIDPLSYLIMPRIFGVSMAVLILNLYFFIFSVFGAIVLTSLFMNVPFSSYAKGIFYVLDLKDVLSPLIKSLIFGFLISTVCCHCGLEAEGTVTRIPQVATKAVVQSLFLVLIVDTIITASVFL